MRDGIVKVEGFDIARLTSTSSSTGNFLILGGAVDFCEGPLLPDDLLSTDATVEAHKAFFSAKSWA